MYNECALYKCILVQLSLPLSLKKHMLVDSKRKRLDTIQHFLFQLFIIFNLCLCCKYIKHILLNEYSSYEILFASFTIRQIINLITTIVWIFNRIFNKCYLKDSITIYFSCYYPCRDFLRSTKV